ncbi:hypothetical protein M271_43400 [Streptomyces rapamycinicus NRRL 5491]|nr:hypothetical protein M271_43400 [Streptomyces rapamycinicus NRRL 5491]
MEVLQGPGAVAGARRGGARIRASTSRATMSAASVSLSPATLAVSAGVASMPSTATAQARRTAAVPRRVSRSLSPLSLAAETSSRSAGRFSDCGFSRRSRILAVSSVTSQGLPPVIAQHSRQNASSAWSPRTSRTILPTPPGVSGASTWGRDPWRSTRVRIATTSAVRSSGR